MLKPLTEQSVDVSSQSTFPESFPKVETFPLLLSDLLRNLTRGNGPSSALRLSLAPANTLSDLQDPRATM